jgi:hypothetical protein
MLQGAEAADVAALSGRHAAASVARWLSQPNAWPARAVPITCRPPLRWISPNAVGRDADEAPRRRFALRSTVLLRRPEIEISQDGRRLWNGRVPRLGPGRSASLPTAWVADVDPAGNAVEVAPLPALS